MEKTKKKRKVLTAADFIFTEEEKRYIRGEIDKIKTAEDKINVLRLYSQLELGFTKIVDQEEIAS